MNELELREGFEGKRPLLEAWGYYVKEFVVASLVESGKEPALFLKIPATHRVKDTNSFVDKALYRKKNYPDPLNDITDQVGVRFVVLLYQEIDIIRNIIEKNDLWLYSLERDYEQEGLDKPYYFDYQSVHYLIWCEEPITYNGLDIQNVKCEVQIRTLLQHAYAELTHDLIYKPEAMIPPEVKRVVGRSMALIETTDNLFMDTARVVHREVEHMRATLTTLFQICEGLHLPINKSDYLNSAMFYSIDSMIQDSTIDEFVEYVKTPANSIRTASFALMTEKNELLFKQPILPLILYLAITKPHTLYEKWDFDQKYLDAVYSQIGMTPPY